MTELLFVLTVIFVAYVVRVIASEHKEVVKQAQTGHVAVKASVAGAQPTPAAVEAAAPMPKPPVAAAPKVRTATTPAVAANTGKGGVRNPKTGEVATIANNYRFIKRWIKEALVAEGLLDRVYKNNELNAESEALIKTALTAFEAMEKYRA